MNIRFRLSGAALLAMAAQGALASGVLPNQIFMDKSFTDDASLQQTRMTMAYDAVNYWSSSGGNTGGNRLAQYDGSGNLLNSYAPGLDMRSIFTGAGGTVFARQFNDPTIYRQTAPGVFTAHVSLVGGTLDAQSAVVLNSAGTEYGAQSAGTLSRWDLLGNHLGNVSLSGFGSMNNEGNYPASRTLAAWNGYYLTYAQQYVSAWDLSGNRVGMAELVGAGTSFDSDFSFSYAADGRLWVVDGAGQTWRGYTIVPEPASMAALGLGALAMIRRRRR